MSTPGWGRTISLEIAIGAPRNDRDWNHGNADLTKYGVIAMNVGRQTQNHVAAFVQHPGNGIFS